MFVPSQQPGCLPAGLRCVLVWLLLSAHGHLTCQVRTWGDEAVRTNSRAIRIATFNTSLYRKQAGTLRCDLRGGANEQAGRLAAILQTARPDIVLLNEFDYEPEHAALKIFLREYLACPQVAELRGLEYPYFFAGPVNTGVDTGLDLDGDGKQQGPNDAFGYGTYEGQYAMALLSRFPIRNSQVRTFQRFLWSDLPDAMVPVNPATNQPYYSDEAWGLLRLSSKSHWHVPIQIGADVVHVLASHPTPPAFDGPEQRNQCRNHDEIRFWIDYLTPDAADHLIDDAGVAGGLNAEAKFVLVGDLNNDPFDGSGRKQAINGLLQHERVQDPGPRSAGGVAATEALGRKNRQHKGDPAQDTANFNPFAVGNLRVDYCLPSRNLRVVASEVFWPVSPAPAAKWVEATDHRLVWTDVVLE